MNFLQDGTSNSLFNGNPQPNQLYQGDNQGFFLNRPREDENSAFRIQS